MRRDDGEAFEMFKGRPFFKQLNKKKNNREAGRDKDKSSGLFNFSARL